MPLNPLIQDRLPQLAALCSQHRATRLDVFGSAVRLDFSPEASDIDFLVEFEPMDAVSYAQTYFNLKEGLEALFQRPVDLLTPSALANPCLRKSKRVRTEQHAVFALRRIPPAELVASAYAPLFDSAHYFVGPVQRDARWRIEFNGLGDLHFCPVVRKTPALMVLARPKPLLNRWARPCWCAL